MSNTVIQIKRSHVNATPTVLANGELAYSFQSNNLFIGANSDTNEVIKIGGGSDVALLNVTPGAVKNGAALVANSTGGIDTLTINSLSIGTQSGDNLAATGNLNANIVLSLIHI